MLAIYIRSALYLLWFAISSVAIFVAVLPGLVLPRRHLVRAARLWAGTQLWGLKAIVGLGMEVRGREHIPVHGAIVASKHMSMWETLALNVLLDDPAIVLKRELLSVPVFGWYARKLDMIVIDRKAHAAALRNMAAHGARETARGRAILIFPEGTRRLPGAPTEYRPGVAGLYAQLNVACVPVAHNSALFWTAGGWIKKPGTVIVEFLPAIPPGLARGEFMARLESAIEGATARLLAEGRARLAAQGIA